jgi:fumarate reductase subunit D
MTNFITHPSENSDGLIKLNGIIHNLKVTRDSARFVFTESDETKLGVVAIAAVLAGQGGQAMSIASGDSEEIAEYLEFELDEKKVKGWVWRNPFKEGDQVEVAAEKHIYHYESFGINRLVDKTIALYPHCSRGRASHVKNAVKWWLIGGGGMVVFIQIPVLFFVMGLKDLLGKGSSLALITSGFLMLFWAFVTFMMTRQWMPFVRLSEKVFHALDLPNPSSIDLVKSSKAQRTDKDSAEFGTFYFRY